MTSADASAALVRERDRDRYLATLYAPTEVRGALYAVHALDLELAEVVRTTTEPMLGQIRLAWWREQLQKLDEGVRPAQPTLSALATEVLPRGITGASLEPLEDANLALLDDDIEAYAEGRAILFEAGARLLAPRSDVALLEQARAIGRGWAIVDAGRRGRSLSAADLERASVALAQRRSPLAVRPLFALGRLARSDLTALKAGRRPPAHGGPGRQLRLLWSIVTGQ